MYHYQLVISTPCRLSKGFQGKNCGRRWTDFKSACSRSPTMQISPNMFAKRTEYKNTWLSCVETRYYSLHFSTPVHQRAIAPRIRLGALLLREGADGSRYIICADLGSLRPPTATAQATAQATTQPDMPTTRRESNFTPRNTSSPFHLHTKMTVGL